MMQWIGRYLLITLFLAIMPIGPGGCAAVVVGGVAVGAYYLGKDERSAQQIADDAHLTATIKAALLANEHLRAWDINVDTYQNAVTLRGSVENQNERKLAEDIARKTAGVKSVESQLAINKVVVEERQNRFPESDQR
jgi:hyperosmotically inducible protein